MILLLAVFLAGVASAEYTIKNNLTLDMKQSVSGEGYFMTYKYARMSGTDNNSVEAKDYSHGSGTINVESILSAQNYNKTEGIDENYGHDYTEALSCIQLKEDNAMIYSPRALGVGTGFYAARPLQFNSLLKEKTWLKNRGSATTMQHEVEYAHALDKELDLLVKDFISEDDPSVSMMNISEDVTAGRTHIGILQGDHLDLGDNDAAWVEPQVYVDEDYWGTYHIEKLMNLTASEDETTEDDDWLPCCSGGYLTMPEAYQKGSKGFGSDVKGIFDCTCTKTPEDA